VSLLDIEKSDVCTELVFCLSNCNTQPLSKFELFQVNMSIQFKENMTLSSPDFNSSDEIKEMYSKSGIKFTTINEHIFVIVDCEKDGNGFMAYSEKYFNYFGVGKTKEDAFKAFVKIFSDKKDGENLSHVVFKKGNGF